MTPKDKDKSYMPHFHGLFKNVSDMYCKHPCISSTFFHKIEAKNQGCCLSTDTSVFGVLKDLINIHKTSSDVKK